MSAHHRIHVFGASGSGTTTLGRALSRKLGVAHVDTDDYYRQPTDPPYTRDPCAAGVMSSVGRSRWRCSCISIGPSALNGSLRQPVEAMVSAVGSALAPRKDADLPR